MIFSHPGLGLGRRSGGAFTIPFSAVKMLSGFEGTHGDSSVVEESAAARTISMTGSTNVFVDSAQQKFGSTSMRRKMTYRGYINYSGDDWYFGSDPWTVEAWVRFNAFQASFEYIVAQYDTNNQRSWALLKNGSALQLLLSSAGTSGITKASGSWSPSTATWYHVAADFDGTTYRTYADGVMIGSETGTISLHNSTAPLTLCHAHTSGAVQGGYDGWMDEARITKGYARYASDSGFTPPAAAFPRS